MERVMSVYINTIGFEYVVLNDGEILDYGIVTVRPVQNDKGFSKVNEIGEYYQPSILILEDYENSNKSERVKIFTKNIVDYWKDKVKIYKYSREQIRNTFDVFGARNKFEISRKIVEIYPQLKTKLPDKRQPWEPENYYQGIFDSLSLVFVYHYLNN